MQAALPLAAPGILTGAIIGLAQALGETAPLIMIGMVAFIVDVPTSVTSPATACRCRFSSGQTVLNGHFMNAPRWPLSYY